MACLALALEFYGSCEIAENLANFNPERTFANGKNAFSVSYRCAISLVCDRTSTPTAGKDHRLYGVAGAG